MSYSNKLKEKVIEFSNSKNNYKDDVVLYKEILELCGKVKNSNIIKIKVMEIFASRYSK